MLSAAGEHREVPDEPSTAWRHRASKDEAALTFGCDLEVVALEREVRNRAQGIHREGGDHVGGGAWEREERLVQGQCPVHIDDGELGLSMRFTVRKPSGCSRSATKAVWTNVFKDASANACPMAWTLRDCTNG